jgi:hypothetical protein
MLRYLTVLQLNGVAYGLSVVRSHQRLASHHTIQHMHPIHVSCYVFAAIDSVFSPKTQEP